MGKRKYIITFSVVILVILLLSPHNILALNMEVRGHVDQKAEDKVREAVKKTAQELGWSADDPSVQLLGSSDPIYKTTGIKSVFFSASKREGSLSKIWLKAVLFKDREEMEKFIEGGQKNINSTFQSALCIDKPANLNYDPKKYQPKEEELINRSTEKAYGGLFCTYTKHYALVWRPAGGLIKESSVSLFLSQYNMALMAFDDTGSMSFESAQKENTSRKYLEILLKNIMADPPIRSDIEPQNEVVSGITDTCSNGEMDEDEDNVDCGGVCTPCNYKIEISPSKAELFADGKSKQDFVITTTLYNKPAKNMSFTITLDRNPKFLESFDSNGRITPTTITTNSEGKANFSYFSPLANGKRYKDAISELAIAGATGQRIYVNLKDPRPWPEITLSQRSMLEGNEMNFIDVKINDEDSKKWKIKVDTSLGTLIPIGDGRGGRVYSIVDTISNPKYLLNWNPPESVMEFVDSYINYAKAHNADATNLEEGLLDTAVEGAISLVGKVAGASGKGGQDLEQALEIGIGVKSYYDQYKNWKGNVEQIQKDINQIKNSSSLYEKFLRSLSLGTESIQTYWGTKKFITEKLGQPSNENEFVSFLKDIGANVIDYGCDSLQSGFRFLADLERESNTKTLEIPVHLIVEVTDEDGFSTKKDAVFNYVYHFLDEN